VFWFLQWKAHENVFHFCKLLSDSFAYFKRYSDFTIQIGISRNLTVLKYSVFQKGFNISINVDRIYHLIRAVNSPRNCLQDASIVEWFLQIFQKIQRFYYPNRSKLITTVTTGNRTRVAPYSHELKISCSRSQFDEKVRFRTHQVSLVIFKRLIYAILCEAWNLPTNINLNVQLPFGTNTGTCTKEGTYTLTRNTMSKWDKYWDVYQRVTFQETWTKSVFIKRRVKKNVSQGTCTNKKWRVKLELSQLIRSLVEVWEMRFATRML